MDKQTALNFMFVSWIGFMLSGVLAVAAPSLVTGDIWSFVGRLVLLALGGMIGIVGTLFFDALKKHNVAMRSARGGRNAQ